MARVVIISSASIGKSMTGPAIRVWELGQVLSKTHEVTLIAPNQPDLESPFFKIVPKMGSGFRTSILNADVLIAQHLTARLAWLVKNSGIKVIIDAYDPISFELLEIYKTYPNHMRQSAHIAAITGALFNFKMADGIICASEKQKDLWLGFLLAHQLVTLPLYDQDRSLKQFIDVVPFGLSERVPVKTGPGLREKYGFGENEKVIVWGGGIWEWFDPLSLIRAMKILSRMRNDVKLVFMGIKGPYPHQMPIMDRTIQLSNALGLTDQCVFFNHGWIPYEERHNYLLDATIGASTHFAHLETRFSFRTRMLDYIWAGLPILATEGDSFAHLVQQYELGEVVPYEDEEAIAKGIIGLIDEPERIKAIQCKLGKICQQFHWNTVAQPLELMIERLAASSKKAISRRDYQVIFRHFAGTGRLFLNKVLHRGLAVLKERS